MEAIANNVTNLSTPGFKRQQSFIEVLSGQLPGQVDALRARARSDFAQGTLRQTGDPLDLAISGSGFFRLRTANGFVYTRQGQFRRADDGTIVNAQGHALQQADSDLVLDRAAVEIRSDGTVLDEGRPMARIGLFQPTEGAAPEPLGGSMFAIPEEAAEDVPESEVRQGMVEASNVSLGDEMVGMMAALREAESGARLIQLYDDLIGRAITTFGQSGR